MRRYLTVFQFILYFFSIVYSQDNKDLIYQTSTITALLEGVYDGNTTFNELKSHGNFGIGTFNNLDGEMTALDGKFYQIKSDGKVYPVDDLQKTPFAVVTSFNEDFSFTTEKADYKKLELLINQNIPSKNLFYAVQITGKFGYVKTRSISRQSKPYPRLIEASKLQTEFEFKNISGTLVGFRIPSFANGMNVSGFHFHFLSEDLTKGGHLLECVLDKGKIAIDQKLSIFIQLPSTAEFYNTNLNSDKQLEIIKIEK